jgi:general secretion pathway protein A
MVLEFYGLREQPFGTTPDPRFVYLSRSYREAFASICIGLQSGHGLQALVSPPGLGKTMVLFQLLEYLRRSARTVFLFHTQCDGADLLRQIVGQLQGAQPPHDGIDTQSALFDILQKEHRLGRRVVLFVDEAHNLEAPALEVIRLLSDFETSTDKLLQIVLAGQAPLARRLLEPELASLKQRISTLARIDALTEWETRAYVGHRLKVAGPIDAPVFGEEALRLVAHVTKGVPREINNVLSSALHLGCAVGARPIERRVIEEVLDDRDLRPLCRTEPRARVGAASRSFLPLEGRMAARAEA